LSTALALAEKIAENGPLGVAATKRLMLNCVEHGAGATRPVLNALRDSIFSSEDAKEGARAFADPRVKIDL
jgi:enoyl-CoA hydratase